MGAGSSSKERRQAIVLEVLRRETVHSQVDLVNLLVSEGVVIDQATLSRDLRSMGIAKGVSGYEVPSSDDVDSAARKRLATLLRANLKTMKLAGNMLVLRVTPGYASPVAAEIDQMVLGEVLGSIAGKDTIFIATESTASSRRIQTLLAGISSRVDLKP